MLITRQSAVMQYGRLS